MTGHLEPTHLCLPTLAPTLPVFSDLFLDFIFVIILLILLSWLESTPAEAEMAHMSFVLACLLVSISTSRSAVFEEHDGEVVLEGVVHLHEGNGSIPTTSLSELLLLISNQTAAEGNQLSESQVSLFPTLGT